jgi:phosphoribosylglycinamide formyltransferase-1
VSLTVNIAIFASGSGTNAENIIQYFENKPNTEVQLVLSNNSEAGVLERAQKHGVQVFTFSKPDLYEKDIVLNKLGQENTDLIVLAGFLWLIPPPLIEKYAPYIVNIHPALLPKYGGKGMYGRHVHEAVLSNNESESGITIHHVNEQYDDGDIIFQKKCKVKPQDTPGTLAERIKKLEHKHYPRVIEQLAESIKKEE